MPTTPDNSIILAPQSVARSARYLMVMCCGILAFVALVVFASWVRVSSMTLRDHVGQIDLNGDKRWYRNFMNLATLEMNDRDILYHGIGQSTENLKKADIVLLGHSALQYAIYSDSIDDFQRKYGVRIFNLTMPGVTSGEFVRRLIEKWDIRPKIWIINADDFLENFFEVSTNDHFATGRNSISAILQTGYIQGFLQVVHRTIRWRIEEFLFKTLPIKFRDKIFPAFKTLPSVRFPQATYRNVYTGNFFLEYDWGYASNGDKIIVKRDQICDASPKEINFSREYVRAIGGTAILTLVPYENWCPARVEQLADTLGLESFFPNNEDFSVFDGTHMVRPGAIAYTAYFLTALEKTRAFQLLIGKPDPGPDPVAAKRSNPSKPVDFCVTNNGTDRMFLSVRAKGAIEDIAVQAGETVRRTGYAGGLLCSSYDVFHHNTCPNPRRQSAAQCP